MLPLLVTFFIKSIKDFLCVSETITHSAKCYDS